MSSKLKNNRCIDVSADEIPRTTQSGLSADRERFRLLHVVKMTIAPQAIAFGSTALARHANFVKVRLFAVAL